MIDLTTHRPMSERSYHGATSRSWSFESWLTKSSDFHPPLNIREIPLYVGLTFHHIIIYFLISLCQQLPKRQNHPSTMFLWKEICITRTDPENPLGEGGGGGVICSWRSRTSYNGILGRRVTYIAKYPSLISFLAVTYYGKWRGLTFATNVGIPPSIYEASVLHTQIYVPSK